MPAPDLAMSYEPEIMPDNVKVSPVLTLIVLLSVKVILPAKELVASDKVPPFKVTALAPTVTLTKSKVPPLLTVTAPPLSLPRPVLLPILKVPPLIVVVPV